jgi:hypothetical protein
MEIVPKAPYFIIILRIFLLLRNEGRGDSEGNCIVTEKSITRSISISIFRIRGKFIGSQN